MGAADTMSSFALTVLPSSYTYGREAGCDTGREHTGMKVVPRRV